MCLRVILFVQVGFDETLQKVLDVDDDDFEEIAQVARLGILAAYLGNLGALGCGAMDNFDEIFSRSKLLAKKGERLAAQQQRQQQQ